MGNTEETGSFGLISLYSVETQNLETASPSISHWMMLAAVAAPFAFLFNAFEFVEFTAIMLAFGAILALWSGHSYDDWNIQPASWKLMATGDVGLFFVAVIGEWWYAR